MVIDQGYNGGKDLQKSTGMHANCAYTHADTNACYYHNNPANFLALVGGLRITLPI